MAHPSTNYMTSDTKMAVSRTTAQLAVATGIRNIDHVSGFQTSISTSETSVWQNGTTVNNYPWAADANTLNIVSTSVNDSFANTGGQVILIDGLDVNGHNQTEEINLNGTTPVTTTKSFLRVNRAECIQAGSSGTVIGNVSVYHTTSNTLVSFINDGNGRSLQSQYSVASDRWAYLSATNMSVGKAQDATIKYYLRRPGGPFRLEHVVTLYQTEHNLQFNYPLPIVPGTDIDVRAFTSAGTATVSVAMTLLFTDV